MVSLHRRFANVYIGWGHKYITYNYSPPSMPPVQDQYIIGPEIMEIQDPTFEQEEAYRISQMPPPPVIPMGKINEINSTIGLRRFYFSRVMQKRNCSCRRGRGRRSWRRRGRRRGRLRRWAIWITTLPVRFGSRRI